MTAAVLALVPEQREAVHALVRRHFGATQYLARMQELLDVALAGVDDEYTGVVTLGGDGVPDGFTVFGPLAGARCVMLRALVGDDAASLRALSARARESCVEARLKMIVCELPDDPAFQAATRALADDGYTEEGRVEDFFADGLAMRLFVWKGA